MKITKRFQWIMGHRLAFHKGKCFTRHGHNYEMKVTIEGFPDENGMLMDFGDLKTLFQELVYIPFDHCFMIYHSDPLCERILQDQVFLLDKTGKQEKTNIVPFETTVENLSKFFFGLFAKEINKEGGRYKVTRVKVYETPTSEAIYYGD